MKTIIIMGVPGCGKTSVLELAIKKLKNKYKIVNYGTLMFEILKTKKLVKTRDEMRKLNEKIQSNAQKQTAEKIKKLAKKQNIIIDTHCSIQTKNSYLIGLPENILKILNPDQIILVESSPKEIFDRRAKDETRVRDNDSVEKINFQQEINRTIALSFCVLTKALFCIVENKTGHLMKSSNDLMELLK
ncbi:MAG: adenylate kinase [Candidatus Aenigmarchaeota archaeon ex4484_52]|nr:MAG: adenylate kinase [Candidatus Aenigmarchaeota archaeon ex4484_52]